MPLREAGLPSGIREPRGGSGIVTCKRSRGGVQLGVGQSRPHHGLVEAALETTVQQVRPRITVNLIAYNLAAQAATQ